MSDLLPTRSKALIRGSKPHGLSCDDWVAGPVLRMYGNGDLLTRSEAANDPEVRRMVIKEWKNKTRWEVTDDE